MSFRDQYSTKRHKKNKYTVLSVARIFMPLLKECPPLLGFKKQNFKNLSDTTKRSLK